MSIYCNKQTPSKGVQKMTKQKRSAVRCEGSVAGGERCKRKTTSDENLCGVCKGRKEKTERRQAQQRKGRKTVPSGSDTPVGSFSLLSHNFTTVWDKLYSIANDLDSTIRSVYPKMVDSRTGTGDPFVGFNRVYLAARATDKGWDSTEWSTSAQWRKKGGKVRKDAVSTAVVVHARAGEHVFPRLITVFNGSQVEFPKGKAPPEPDKKPEVDHGQVFAELVETMGNNLGIEIESGPDSAERPGVFYPPGHKSIVLDSDELARSEAENTLQLLHELIHLVGPLTGEETTSEAETPESKMEEEMYAVWGTALAASHLGISLEGDPGRHHARYLKGWHKKSQTDAEFLMRTTSVAGQRVSFVIDNGVLLDSDRR